MATFEGKPIGEFGLILEPHQVQGYETVTADELIAGNPDYFTSREKAEAEVQELRRLARAYRAWERNGFALQNDDYVLD